MDYKRISISFIILATLFMIMVKQFLKFEGQYRLLYVLLFFMFLLALYYETMSNGCGIIDCSDKTVENSIDTKNLACRENDRVSWRRSMILSFIILTMTNFINTNYQINLILFFMVFLLLYFYFNFDAFHRFRVLCNK